MSKKALIISTIFFLIIFGALGWYFFIYTADNSSAPTGTQTEDNLFPFGQGSSGGDARPPVTTTPDEPINTGEINTSTGLPRLRQISSVPTASITVFDIGSSTLMRYVERATGHIFETTNTNANARKISSVTIPKVYEALWSPNGSRIILRYLKDENETIKTFSAVISTSTNAEDALEGIFLPDNIRDITLLGAKIYYIIETGSGSNGITANLDGSGKTSVFPSSFSDWTAVWTSPTGITLNNKPSGEILGVSYLLNPQNGSYVKIIGEYKGMKALANTDATYALTSLSEENSMKLVAIDLKTFTQKDIGLKTVIDKCVWSKKEKTAIYCAAPLLPPSAMYPDDWYKGKVSFNDSLWKIDVATGETQEILNPFFDTGLAMDIIDITLNQSETTLVFRNKKDLFGWSYDLVK